jgi:hypothetical protein
MKIIARYLPTTRLAALLLGSAGAFAMALSPVGAEDRSSGLMPRSEGWIVTSRGQIEVPGAPKDLGSDLAKLRSIVAKRTADDVARFRWWEVGGPTYRWNEMMIDEMQDNFVVLPLAARHLALFHAALDDAVAAARGSTGAGTRTGTSALDAALNSAIQSKGRSNPSDYAAAAAAAAEVMGFLFPHRAAHFSTKAGEAIEVRLLAGVELPHAMEAGRAIGRKVAALAIARAKSDGNDAKWQGSVPEGDGKWKGSNPIAPLAGTWKAWVLGTASEFRPAGPPAVGSEQVKKALVELKEFKRTPKTNHRAIYWEVHGGARAHSLWNEIARMKLLESGLSQSAGSRILAALNIAIADAGVACWDAKYTFWYIRPPQLDPELKSLFTPPNHPSYPAAHGCFSTAAATVLGAVFPQDRERLLGIGKEAAEARVWAGIHYRFDIDAGQEIGRKVAEKVLRRAFVSRTN